MTQNIQSPQKLLLSIDGQMTEVMAQKIGTKIWYQTAKGTFDIEIESAFSSRKSRQSLDSQSNQILSPMPGKITKVLVDVGAETSAGQGLIVMEAMKMEYTLKSPVIRKVKKILALVGQQVTLGQPLIEFDEAQNG